MQLFLEDSVSKYKGSRNGKRIVQTHCILSGLHEGHRQSEGKEGPMALSQVRGCPRVSVRYSWLPEVTSVLSVTLTWASPLHWQYARWVGGLRVCVWGSEVHHI